MNREMEDVETKLCENCKREIPTVNFTIHSVHCARNIRVCPVCKEPVLYAELKDHHEKLHKLQPCKKCGESVCGTDLEDHVRDSCAHTIKSCRFCELELPRRDLPAHENYCGVRTEQCPECQEWVMIKYRQLHVDSNHGFIRLDDDPAPAPKKEFPKLAKPMVSKMTNTNSVAGNTNIPSTSNNGFSRPTTSNVNNGVSRPTTSNVNNGAPRPTTSNVNNGAPRPTTSNVNNGLTRPTTSNINNRTNGLKNINLPRDEAPRTGPVNTSYFSSGSSSSSSSSMAGEGSSMDWRTAQAAMSNGSKKRTNDQPQINTNVEANTNKVDKDLSISRGAVKKRPAPKPPLRSPPAASQRDLPYYSALQRQQREERARQEQNAYNLSVGLPAVLNPAEKIEKLRKMDALQNPESFVDYKNRVQGRMSRSPETQVQSGHVLGSAAAEDPERRQHEFKNLKPMTPQEFLERFSAMQLRKDEELRRNSGEGDVRRKGGDRFSEIKSSLRELRRGLNEVTAPYHSIPNIIHNPNNNNNNNGNDRAGRASPPNEDVRLPCEFCNSLIPAHNLVQHQTGCRPDLAQLRARSTSPGGAAALPREELLEPVIPCEFCAQSLPVYLISEHQERCGREANLLYPD